jgi:hypothetical protein
LPLTGTKEQQYDSQQVLVKELDGQSDATRVRIEEFETREVETATQTQVGHVWGRKSNGKEEERERTNKAKKGSQQILLWLAGR